jgi:hypothetical protein
MQRFRDIILENRYKQPKTMQVLFIIVFVALKTDVYDYQQLYPFAQATIMHPI